MTAHGTNQPVNELDLLACADGFLDTDPERRAEIERAAQHDPELKARLEAYRAQSAALRRSYDYRIREAVPDHLLAIIDSPPPRRSQNARAAAAVAAVLALMTCTGLAGWSLGRGGGGTQGGDEFVARSYDNFVALPQALRQAATERTEPMNWLSQKLSLTLRAPDLSTEGYSIVDTRTVQGGNHDDMLRITYAGEEGRNFSLFLYPRWQKDSLSIQMVHEGDVSLAYWLEGPLASVIASRLPPGELRAISEAVRRSLNDPAVTRPELGPAPPAAGKVAGGLVQPDAGATVLPESAQQGTVPVLQDIRPN